MKPPRDLPPSVIPSLGKAPYVLHVCVRTFSAVASVSGSNNSGIYFIRRHEFHIGFSQAGSVTHTCLLAPRLIPSIEAATRNLLGGPSSQGGGWGEAPLSVSRRARKGSDVTRPGCKEPVV